MPRTTNEDDYNEKRNQIIDAGMKFIFSIGYENMSIQNVLDELKISKGAFYHYFSSKEDLLIGTINRMGQGIFDEINPIVYDTNLSGIEKMNKYFSNASIIKMEQAEYMIPLTRIWVDEKNLHVREKLISTSGDIIAPILTQFVQQGIEEGDFSTSHPELIGEVIYQIFITMGNSIIKHLISINEDEGKREKIHSTFTIFTEIIEKTLNAPKGTICIINDEALNRWMDLFLRTLN